MVEGESKAQMTVCHSATFRKKHAIKWQSMKGKKWGVGVYMLGRRMDGE